MTTLMAPFDFEQPSDLDQVFELVKRLKQQHQRFIFAGGNTDLLPKFKQGVNVPDCLISLTAIDELNGISLFDREGQHHYVRIGAATRLDEIINHKIICSHFPELARVAGLVANPQIRNQATIGGNILVDNRCIYIDQSELNRECHSPCFKAGGDVCHLVKSAKRGDKTLCQARFVSDTVPILLLLGARLVAQNQQHSRKIALRDFYCQDGIERNRLGSDELLVAIELPLVPHKHIHYEKLAIRNTLDFPSVGVAVALTKDRLKTGTNQDNFTLEIALTGIQTLPGYFTFASKNCANVDDLLNQACQQSDQFSLLYQQDFFPRAYRKKMIAVFIRRCFKKIMAQINEDD